VINLVAGAILALEDIDLKLGLAKLKAKVNGCFSMMLHTHTLSELAMNCRECTTLPNVPEERSLL